MLFDAERGIAACGLACCACRETQCGGCATMEGEGCDIRRCARGKGIDGCYACDAFPCEQPMFAGSHRQRAFVRYVRAHGVAQLIERLAKNYADGIAYHGAEGLTGDYDALPTEQAVQAMLAFGRGHDPYAQCPVFDTEHFHLRLVEQDDAAALLACYSDPAAQRVFNADCCTDQFCYSTVGEMAAAVSFFLRMYRERAFVRWTVLDRRENRPIGTVEMFAGDNVTGILRIDIESAYEKEALLRELLRLAKANFPLLFGVAGIACKAIPEAGERRCALKTEGFAPFDFPGRTDYFAHQGQ